jgi:hypothetical protein
VYATETSPPGEGKGRQLWLAAEGRKVGEAPERARDAFQGPQGVNSSPSNGECLGEGRDPSVSWPGRVRTLAKERGHGAGQAKLHSSLGRTQSL